ncbi:hypothetical protein QVD17_27462 [Tagetes erecta]|uniref:Uncharacterized protein n=1 Tax=Tagetes erecta TaxID=13708 RepID=A0AAD8K956_TARER|nr:hypothetical protein QVD17_27462 [Tagetes erecta]
MLPNNEKIGLKEKRLRVNKLSKVCLVYIVCLVWFGLVWGNRRNKIETLGKPKPFLVPRHSPSSICRETIYHPPIFNRHQTLKLTHVDLSSVFGELISHLL